jgi:hypothetical protein
VDSKASPPSLKGRAGSPHYTTSGPPLWARSTGPNCQCAISHTIEARAGRAGGLPGPLLARAPAAPVRSGALCAARRCSWQYVWFALEAPFRVQHLLPSSSGKLHHMGRAVAFQELEVISLVPVETAAGRRSR